VTMTAEVSPDGWEDGEDGGWPEPVIDLREGALRLPLPLPVPGDWHGLGACRGEDTELFYDEARVAEAKLVCNTGCPVRAECEAYAIENRVSDGVWGGKTPRERDNVSHREKKRRWREAQRARGLPAR
jgi:hypothetical protein